MYEDFVVMKIALPPTNSERIDDIDDVDDVAWLDEKKHLMMLTVDSIDTE